jgi:hypothetical protein
MLDGLTRAGEPEGSPEAPRTLDQLEVNLGAELKYSPGRIGVVRCDTPERAGRIEVLPRGNILRKREIGVVEDIERFQTKFNPLGFGERYQFAESQIGIVDPWAMEVVPSFVPQHAGRFLRESVRVEVVVGLSRIRSELEGGVARIGDPRIADYIGRIPASVKTDGGRNRAL